MPPQKTANLLKELQQEVERLEKQASEATARRDIAQRAADNLESRHKLMLADVEADVAKRKQELEAELGGQITELKGQIPKLHQVKQGLEAEIDELLKSKPAVEAELEELGAQKLSLSLDIETARRELDSIATEVADSQEKAAKLESRQTALLNEIRELEDRQTQLNEDIELLGNEAGKLEDAVIEQDAVLKAAAADYKAKIAEAESRLKGTLERLLEAERRDKDIRSSWAEGQLELDKREKVVRKREKLTADTESRVAQYDDFMKI